MVGKRILQVAAGWNHSLVLLENGDLYACGYGANGQLGLGDKESKT
jgi:alpha-tubulin suppressor-like RCC1 family protein